MSLRILRFLTAGESHGQMLVGILDGLPAGIRVDTARVDAELKRRMGGHGRGKRMQIESDCAIFVGGIRHGETLGSPVAWLIENRDWPNWLEIMAIEPAAAENAGDAVAESGNRPSPAERRRITRPRPGHADLAGGIKYNRRDLRDILERASARETAARVAGGAVAKQFLEPFGIDIASHVIRIGSAALAADAEPISFDAAKGAEDSPVRCADLETSDRMVAAIDSAHNDLETLGGTFEVIARGLPVGLGSHVQWDRKLEGRLGQALLSIQAQKGVEIGPAAWCAGQPGSKAHDAVYRSAEGIERRTNFAGGTEGGITYGSELRTRVHMKPLATVRQPLPSVDIDTGAAVDAVVQRSDVCAVPAAGVVGEAMVALVIADAMLEKFGGDSLGETLRNFEAYQNQADGFIRTDDA